MLAGLGEAGSTLGQWDGTGQCNSLLMSGARLMSNQDLLVGHKSGRTRRAFVSPICPLHPCNSYLSSQEQDPASACQPHFALGSLLCRFLGGLVRSTKTAENCSLLFSLL